jgi:serine/threonine protein kinase
MAVPQAIGRYEVIRPLGYGGMGAVYLARDPVLGRQVAVKVLREFGDNPDFRERFEREARAIAALQHRNIVTIYELGEADGHPFIVMEYLSGQSLSAVIENRVELSLARRLGIILDVCAGLAYAHQAGMVHRDVKPGNVMLVEDGTAKILDFGLARLGRAAEDRRDLTATGTMFGTPAYMSPEMITGRPVDHRADIFAVGVMLYELSTYQKPFSGDVSSIAGFVMQILRHDPPPPSSIVPLPPELDAIVARCLQKEPDARYQRLDEMAVELRRLRDSLTVEPELPVRLIAPAPPPPLPAHSGSATIVAEAPGPVAAPPPVIPGDGTVIIAPDRSPGAEEEDAGVRLHVGRSPDPRIAGQTIPIKGAGVIVLGRGSNCDIVVNDPGWSRRHASIHCRDGSFEITDLGSANGTFVNGRRVPPNAAEPLFFGATITIGETVLAFSYGRDTTLPDLSGVVVAQRYRLQRLLRESAKAALYAARDGNVPRDVAMKLLSPELARYAGYREQFEREARTAAALQHPHICQVLDSGFTRITTPAGRRFDTHFLCFELMAGGSLAARFKQAEPIPLPDVHRWTDMLGSALHYAHQQEVVHGDLKPSAIVFDAAGNLYLTDFSIAQKAIVDGRGTVGSPPFMAPEQWEGSAPTPASDQFAFAALVYCMLSGSRPFEGQDNPEIREKNFRRGPVPVHVEAAQNGRVDVTRAASDVLGRALSLAPANRFPSVEHFARALRKAFGTGHVAGTEPMVFISYDRELSGGWARFFADRLKLSHGIKVFMDTTGLDRAGRFPPRLRRAIEECDVFICFLAGRSLHSKWVSEEIRIAHELKKTMIPIFQESFADPDQQDDQSPVGTLIAHQGVKLFDVSGHFVEHAVTDLATLVKGAVAGDADFV